MQVNISVRFHRDEITYFEMNRLYPYVKQIQQAGYMRMNSLLIKVQVKNRLFTKNWLTRPEILLVSFLVYVIFLITPVLLLPKLGAQQHSSLPKWGDKKHSHKNINIPVFQICSRDNKTLLLYACEIIYLINKRVISPYVQV